MTQETRSFDAIASIATASITLTACDTQASRTPSAAAAKTSAASIEPFDLSSRSAGVPTRVGVAFAIILALLAEAGCATYQPAPVAGPSRS